MPEEGGLPRRALIGDFLAEDPWLPHIRLLLTLNERLQYQEAGELQPNIAIHNGSVIIRINSSSNDGLHPQVGFLLYCRFESELRNKLAFKASSKVALDALLFKTFKFFDLNNAGYVPESEFYRSIAKVGVVFETAEVPLDIGRT